MVSCATSSSLSHCSNMAMNNNNSALPIIMLLLLLLLLMLCNFLKMSIELYTRLLRGTTEISIGRHHHIHQTVFTM